jgi:methylase of polypeptide subunit release factors
VTAPTVAGRGAALTSLGISLRAAGYTPVGLATALGAEGPLVEGVTLGDRRRRARRAGVLGVAARLLLLGETLPDEDWHGPAERLVAALFDLGLVEQAASGLVATVIVVPHDDLLVAADRFDADRGPDVVPGVQPPSYLLGCLTIRRPVARALDLGTGCGIQSLLLSPLADRVIATDVNERALGYTELNAALNGRTNIEPRLGSLFEPVSDERFGVIVANPPYVISPDRHFTFRDSELGGEEICQQVVTAAPGHLEAGGHATVLASWDATGEDPLATPVRWASGGDCDALVLGTAVLDAERNAERWNVGAQRDAAVDRWVDYLRARGIARVGYGAVILRRSGEGTSRVRALQVGDTIDRPAGTHLLRMLDAPDNLRDDARVRLVPSACIREQRRLAHDGWRVDERELVLLEGLEFRTDLDPDDARLVAALDGRLRVDEVAATAEQRAYVERLVALGFAEVG